MDQGIQRLFQLQYEMIDRLKAETTAIQFLLDGLVRELVKTPNGKEMLASAFDTALDQAVPLAIAPDQVTGYATHTLALIEAWRNALEV